jgi:hypothetical protein
MIAAPLPFLATSSIGVAVSVRPLSIAPFPSPLAWLRIYKLLTPMPRQENTTISSLPLFHSPSNRLKVDGCNPLASSGGRGFFPGGFSPLSSQTPLVHFWMTQLHPDHSAGAVASQPQRGQQQECKQALQEKTARRVANRLVA